MSFDVLITAVAVGGAFLLRFEGRIPAEYVGAPARALAALVPIRLALAVALGLYRWSFQMSGLLEAMRLAAATVGGTVILLVYTRIPGTNLLLPRSIVVLEFFLTTSLMAAMRFAPRLLAAWANDLRTSHSAGARRTLIVGAGNSGDLLLRDLSRSSDRGYCVVGLVDDDLAKAGTWIGGKPVLGPIADLPRLILAHRVSTVMLAIPSLAGVRVREILRLCSAHKASFKIARPSFSANGHGRAAGMLHDLSPEDLLQRNEVAFDPAELRPLLEGRRVLVTGGAGSIGGEIARQAAAFGAGLVVLVDMNENDLYFRFRRLSQEYPHVQIRAEVADVREPARLLHLGRKYSPQYVFHAAAHKHVPLMEDAPEEAIKNNVFGTINVASMASACGAERLVLISTDKAVKPSSVMGASKRVAELAVRDMAHRSATRMIAVRFGNVLGSAGSVVPLFKQQIERGGPVTVTHPDCTRYFMTISEAVGLVLVAGIRDYGDLCVLDMGQPIRIADLAANMVTMAGYIPGVEIPIVYAGLRPGEKLHEEPLTEDEERAHSVRSRIKVASSPPPPPDLAHRLEDLRRAADGGDREAIVSGLRALVPTYQPGPARSAPQPEHARKPSPRAALQLVDAFSGASP